LPHCGVAIRFFEAIVGLLILGMAHRRIGIGAEIGFNAALMLFGWGFCLCSIPMIALLLRFWCMETRPSPSGDGSARSPRE
jgi:hypothetical protein